MSQKIKWEQHLKVRIIYPREKLSIKNSKKLFVGSYKSPVKATSLLLSMAMKFQGQLQRHLSPWAM